MSLSNNFETKRSFVKSVIWISCFHFTISSEFFNENRHGFSNLFKLKGKNDFPRVSNYWKIEEWDVKFGKVRQGSHKTKHQFKKKGEGGIYFENSEKGNDAESFEFMVESFKAVNISVGENRAQN
jgi:hypothetical protein